MNQFFEAGNGEGNMKLEREKETGIEREQWR